MRFGISAIAVCDTFREIFRGYMDIHPDRLNLVHIAAVVAGEAQAQGFQRLGLLGTRWLVRSEVYPETLRRQGIECVRPGADAAEDVNRIIMEELVNGYQTESSLAALQHVIVTLRETGCDAVVLGCTELPLVLNDANSPLPTLDSTRLLARAALRRAVGVV